MPTGFREPGAVIPRATKQPLVTVGIPTFNRPIGLRRTLDNITGQTYRHLQIVISDNCSPDPRVAAVIAEFRDRDSRISAFRQPTNIGPTDNFRFVLDKAAGTYFMWAADDDSWEPEYVATLVALLESHPSAALAFSNFDAIDGVGERVRHYPDFLPYIAKHAGATSLDRLSSYIDQEEQLGKANLIYGLYRTDVLRAAGGVRLWGLGTWGADMLIVSSVLARGSLQVSDRLMYHVGTEPLLLESPQALTLRTEPTPAHSRPLRILAAIAQHSGYMAGYARVVLFVPGLSFLDRIRLMLLILKRLMVIVQRDLRMK